MAKVIYKNGITGVILRVKIRDSSTGNGKTGLTTGTSGLVISTIADPESSATSYSGSNLQTIATLGTFAAPTSGKCRFGEVDATHHPGLYEIQIADARWAVSNARSIVVSVIGVTGTLDCDAEVQLSALDLNAASTPQTGDSFARLGAPAGASVSADVAAVNAKTTNLPASPASTTNITAGTITTVTNLTNAASSGDLTATMKASVTTAATAATPNLNSAYDGAKTASQPGDAMTLTSALDIYTADIDWNANGATDEYSVTWKKNGIRQTSGITVPTIEVIKRSDGTDLVASTSMTQIGSSGSYKYDEASNRIPADATVLVVVTATINAASRSWSKFISNAV